MSSSGAPLIGGLTIEENLELYLIAFNAAVAAFRPFSVTSFGTSDLGDDYTKVTVDLSSRGQLPEGTTEAQETSYKKLNLCDTFYDILFEEVEERLQPYHASVKYAVVDPKPTRSLVTRDEKPLVLHSVFQIRKQDGSEVIFDGTAEQFGWPVSNAIMKGDDFWHHYTNSVSSVDGFSTYGMSLERSKRNDNGYWYDVGISLRQMLRSLDWASLEGMATSDREDYVRVEAMRRAQAAAQACWG
ncbi:hypothetical protein BKA58DRAFT_438671 [Alternaria rosae]|uniref:uncharacterized protein n=1 Tax=Alternaria rosae TaxID=1187941 RepID=UPI001E8E1233|nr:uncharacterized protein BKA58DRAFT_438671 [Alternaria rosae]KAH6872563.1 hypothetical protein BKA58DRAFT_438671 [Alternaria rosae]